MYPNFYLDNSSYCLLLLPSLLREEIKVLFQSFGIEDSMVQISCKHEVSDLVQIVQCQSYSVTVDGNETATTTTLAMAIEMVFALHYIFNLSYPKKLESYFKFIQKDIVKLHDNVVPNSEVLKLISILTH